VGQEITKHTRLRVFEAIGRGGTWSRALDELTFLSRLYDLDKLPSLTGNNITAADEIRRHRIENPQSWPDDWIVDDSRFQLLEGLDEVFLRFICQTISPEACPVRGSASESCVIYNEILEADGFELIVRKEVRGSPTFGWSRCEPKERSPDQLSRASKMSNTRPLGSGWTRLPGLLYLTPRQVSLEQGLRKHRLGGLEELRELTTRHVLRQDTPPDVVAAFEAILFDLGILVRKGDLVQCPLLPDLLRRFLPDAADRLWATFTSSLELPAIGNWCIHFIASPDLLRRDIWFPRRNAPPLYERRPADSAEAAFGAIVAGVSKDREPSEAARVLVAHAVALVRDFEPFCRQFRAEYMSDPVQVERFKARFERWSKGRMATRLPAQLTPSPGMTPPERIAADFQITRVTKLLLRDLILAGLDWYGRFKIPVFLDRICNLAALPSHDRRFRTAAEDLDHHCVVNPDDWRQWGDEWPFDDSRFGLTPEGDDDVFLRFLCETLHPEVRPDTHDAMTWCERFNEVLRVDGWELRPIATVSGHPVFGPHRVGSGLVEAVPPSTAAVAGVQQPAPGHPESVAAGIKVWGIGASSRGISRWYPSEFFPDGTNHGTRFDSADHISALEVIDPHGLNVPPATLAGWTNKRPQEKREALKILGRTRGNVRVFARVEVMARHRSWTERRARDEPEASDSRRFA
jgi:hypothetical protein